MFSFFISSPIFLVFLFLKILIKKKTKKQIPPKKNNKELKGNVLYIFLFFTTLLLVFSSPKKNILLDHWKKNNIVYREIYDCVFNFFMPDIIIYLIKTSIYNLWFIM